MQSIIISFPGYREHGGEGWRTDVEEQMENNGQKRKGLSKWELRLKTIELLVKTKRAFSADSMIYSSSSDNKDYSNFCLVNEKLIFLNKKKAQHPCFN